jgi:hypothetical protein
MRLEHGTLRTFPPSAPWYGAYTTAAVVGVAVIAWRAGPRILSPVGVGTIVVALLILAYLALFAFRLWVYIYDDRVEIHPSLAKMVRDCFGLTLYVPKVVYFRDVITLRRTRGFGGYNALVLVRRASRWQRSEYGIPIAGVQRYDELEREIRRRVPAMCRLESLNFLGKRGPLE